MTDHHVRPEEYRPKWTYRRIVIWASIFYSLGACALLSYSFSFEAVKGTAATNEIAGYVTLVICHMAYLALVTFQYVWGATQELKEFFEFLAKMKHQGE